MTFVGTRRHGEAEVTVDGRRLALPRLTSREARHSPDGFEWGYNGSGPAELARAVLMRVFPDQPAVREPRCYQIFKSAVIARLPEEGFVLVSEQVEAWYQGWSAGTP